MTGVVIDGLKGAADDNRDGKITQRELMNYVDRLMVTSPRNAFPTQPQQPVLHYGTADVDLFQVRIHQRSRLQPVSRLELSEAG